MIRHKVNNPILAVGIALILPVTLTSHVYRDLAKTDFPLPDCTFENINEECLEVPNANRGDRLKAAFFSIFSEPQRGLLKEDLYPLPDMPYLCEKNLVLRC